MTVLKFWDGVQWQSVAGGVPEVYAQPTQPTSVNNGALWIDTDQGVPIATLSQIIQVYTITAGYTPDRVLNPVATSIGEVATVLATLIDDLKAAGVIRQ